MPVFLPPPNACRERPADVHIVRYSQSQFLHIQSHLSLSPPLRVNVAMPNRSQPASIVLLMFCGAGFRNKTFFFIHIFKHQHLTHGRSQGRAYLTPPLHTPTAKLAVRIVQVEHRPRRARHIAHGRSLRNHQLELVHIQSLSANLGRWWRHMVNTPPNRKHHSVCLHAAEYRYLVLHSILSHRLPSSPPSGIPSPATDQRCGVSSHSCPPHCRGCSPACGGSSGSSYTSTIFFSSTAPPLSIDGQMPSVR